LALALVVPSTAAAHNIIEGAWWGRQSSGIWQVVGKKGDTILFPEPVKALRIAVAIEGMLGPEGELVKGRAGRNGRNPILRHRDSLCRGPRYKT